MKINRYDYISLLCSEQETEAVQLALTNLRRDLIRVLHCSINAEVNASVKKVIVGTVGVSEEIEAKADISLLKDERGDFRKEAFLIQVKNEELLIAGTDRRGTVYGIYDFCQNQLGVSPWYFFADVPVKEKSCVCMEDDYLKVDYPSIEYRGIFINDEEELDKWVQNYMGERTIGVKTYEKIFELLLRLKMNYIWPAMHVNSFNLLQENGALANKMGVVVGTSHCDMLMRSNNREWKPWIAKKGYEGVEYDYSIPGRNREILEEYWRESVQQNKDFEVSYTLGMRGIHDSGFETKTLAGKTGEELLQAKIELLDSVIKAQHKMLEEGLEYEPVKTFVPYKEVLELYDNGLEVPEDLTLIWVNDNYGYVRRYPGEKEKQRKGGNGIYYHNSYWAPPGGSYLFICSIPLSHTRNELKKAYEEGIRKIWVTNFGALKPLEQQMSFYARFAWEAGRENAITDNEELFLEEWINQTFSGEYGKRLAPILLAFDQITNVRKVEQMDTDVFSQNAYGDEAAARIHEYEYMFEEANRIYQELPRQEKDAFFQLVLMKIHAAYFTNCMYYYADRSNLCMEQGKAPAAAEYTELSKTYDRARRSMLYYYNKVMANGKWDGILTPEDFPPPRTAMHPACMPPITIGEKKLIVTVWNDDEKLTFHEANETKEKWLEIANGGNGAITYHIEGPDWLSFSATDGIVELEHRILVKINTDSKSTGKEALEGVITVCECETGAKRQIPVTYERIPEEWKKQNCIYETEEDGKITVEAVNASKTDGWLVIPNLGRYEGSLVEARKEGSTLDYYVALTNEGEFTLEIHRFPTLNSVGQIRVGISVDDGDILEAESASKDEYCGNWKYNIRNNVDKMLIELPKLKAGVHKVSFHAIDKYFSFSRFVIYTKECKENSLGFVRGSQALPIRWDVEAFVNDFYGECLLEPRPVFYLPIEAVGDTLTMEDVAVIPCEWGKPVTPSSLVEAGNAVQQEMDGIVSFDAAAALAESEYAYTTNGLWQYCNSPSYGETGLAMYIRKEGLSRKDVDEAPTLNYRVNVKGGDYRIWIRAHMWGTDTSHFTISLDEKAVPEKELYGGAPIWRYSMEQVWEWIPVWKQELTQGEHLISIHALSSHLRIEKIYMTTGDELPPAEG